MRYRVVWALLLVFLAGAALQAGECPSGKVPVTFRYVPLLGETVTSVSLRGTFNDWGEWPMERQPDGTWSITVCLAPGEYQYKYFINGQWPKDMSTARGGGPVDFDADGYVDDGFGGKNAIRKVGSYLSGKWDFKMKLLPSPAVDHHELDLTYTFAGFDFKSITKFGNEQGFIVSGVAFGRIGLEGGMWLDINAAKYKYAYFEVKPIIAGVKLDAKAEHWVEGYLPEDRCPVPVTFRYIPAPGETVTSVNVAGDFDDWNPSDTETAMRYDPATGEWSVTIYLTPGPIRYKYVINGSWPGNMQTDHPVTGGPVDPDLPTDPSVQYLYYVDDGFGGKNAVRVIRATCPRADTVPVTFRYIPASGETVTSVNVAGDFDGWNPSDAATAMSYDPATGEWSVTIYLTPGPHQYKYVINGSWVGNMATDHPISGGPVDPDAEAYYYENAVRLVEDPMPAYMRYTLSAEWGNFKGTLRFEDCCCGTMFKDLTVTFSDLSLCCGVSYSAELYFTKHGFRHIKFTADNLSELCCGIGVGVDVVFGVDYKQVTPKFSWGGISGCLNVYGDVTGGGGYIGGIEIYGLKLRCDLAECNWIEVLTAFDVAKIEEIFKADIFQGQEYEYVKLGFCGPSCCGGKYDLTVTTFFGGGGLFDITRIWIDATIPLTEDLSAVVNLSPTLGELYVGWNWTF